MFIRLRSRWSLVFYFLLNLVEMPLGGGVDEPPREVVIVRTSDGAEVYRERGYHGEEAFIAALTFIEGINKYGLSDYVFRRSHGWSEE